jgi:hypothetical protein
MTEHNCTRDCGCTPTPAEMARLHPKHAEHICDPFCYHRSDKYKRRVARQKARKLHEAMWNGKTSRPRQPYPKDPVVPLHLVGVLPLMADGRTPTNLEITEARKGYTNRRNKRRRQRP